MHKYISQGKHIARRVGYIAGGRRSIVPLVFGQDDVLLLF